MPRTPNLIIAGVNKAGTTSLFTYLSNHPEVFPSTIKETCYFLPLRYNKAVEPFNTYLNYFKNCNKEKYLLESTPGYFYGGDKLTSSLKETLPNAKLIISLRNPVDRLISFYRFKKNHLEIPSDIKLQEYVSKCKSLSKADFANQDLNKYFGLEGGKYIDYIKDWEIFDPKNILFVDFDELKSSPQLSLNKICNWLDIDPAVYSSYDFNLHNKSVEIKNKGFQKVALAANKKLEKVFRQNQKIKKSLRTIYYKLNGKKFQEEIDSELLSELNNFYTSYNQKLLNYFQEKGRVDTPNWLKNHKTLSTN